MSPLRATTLLTLDLLRRLLREGVVLRSLVFPVLLAGGTMMLTVFAFVLLSPTQTLVLTPDAQPPALIAEVEAQGWPIMTSNEPARVVRQGRAAAGTDGKTIWTYRGGTHAVRLESMIRKHFDAPWRPNPPPIGGHPDDKPSEGSRHLLQFIGALFAFYGVVFGAGSIARDRDEGTLEAELATALPMWVHGCARWLAGSILLAAFFTYSVMAFDAFIGVARASVLITHGIAACAGSTAIGILVIGRAGLESGFAAPMSAGLVMVVTLLSLGLSGGEAMSWIPIASMLTDAGHGWLALTHACAWGAASVVIFTRRSTVQ